MDDQRDVGHGDLLAQARTLAANPLVRIDHVTGLGSTREFVGLLADEIEKLRRQLDDEREALRLTIDEGMPAW